MKELKGNIWRYHLDGSKICVSTNGFVKFNGECVMGRGIANQAKKKYPGIALELGKKIKEKGNRVYELSHDLVSFPVKSDYEINCGTNVVKHWRKKVHIGDKVPGWMCKARMEIIEKSAKELVELADKNKWEDVKLIRVGCGWGELDWFKDVKPVLEEILDDRFSVVNY